MVKKKTQKPALSGHVISHTHWDRAWYLPFEQFRLRLVNLVGKVLDICEHDPSYRFWLDGQTVPVEDFLEICPDDRERIARLVRRKQLFVGPLYVVPDFFLITGESIIRDFQIGMRQSAAYGHVPMVGVMADAFGYPSQMPQILQQFGFDNAVLHRGVTDAEKKQGWVQTWEGPDTSRVILYLCAGWGYANLFYWGIDAFNPECYPTIPTDADEWSAEVALKQLRYTLDDYAGKGRLNTGHLYLGNGVDHQEAQPHTPELVRRLNRMQNDVRLRVSTYEEMIAAVRRETGSRPVIRGPLRDCSLHGTLTSRVYLKQAYARIAGRLEMLTEPLLMLAGLYARGHRAFREPGHMVYTLNAGQNWAAFPYEMSGRLDYLWKLLLRNAPHDDICGCSVDATHADMDNRFKRAEEVNEYLLNDALLSMAHRSIPADDTPLPVVAAFNPHAFVCRHPVAARVFLPGVKGLDGWAMYDAAGREVPFQTDNAARTTQPQFDGMKFLDPAEGLNADLMIDADLPALAFASFTLRKRPAGPGKAAARCGKVKKGTGRIAVVNDFYTVTIHANGTFDLYDRGSNRRYRGLGLLEDVEDIGHTYTHKRMKRPAYVRAEQCRGKLRVTGDGAVSTTVEVHFTLHVPAGFDAAAGYRTRQTVPLQVHTKVTVFHGRKAVRVDVTVDNRAKDHELFMLFPTGLETRTFQYDSKFDWASYKVGEKYSRIDSTVMAAAGRQVLAVTGDCPTLVLSRKERGKTVFGMSLFRSVEQVSMGVPTEVWRAPGAQCLQAITRSYMLVTGRPAETREAALQNRRLLIAPPPAVAVTPRERHRYRDRRHTALVPGTKSLLTVSGHDVHLSCLKTVGDGQGVVIRLVNLGTRTMRTVVTTRLPVSGARHCGLDEKPGKALAGSAAKGFRMTIPARGIATVLLVFDRRAIRQAMRTKRKGLRQ